MDEFQLVETYREGFAVLWAQLQWWASVSFGLLALASFGRKHMTLAVTIGLSTLYVLFSVFCAVNVLAMTGHIVAAVAELSTLEGVSDVGKSISGSVRIGQLNGLVASACFLATACGTLTYLWHAYHKNKPTAA